MMKQYAYRRLILILSISIILLCVGYPTIVERSSDTAQDAVSIPTLHYGYAAPAVQAPGAVQISEFNSFIGHDNTIEIYNSTDQAATAKLEIINFDGTPLSTEEHVLPPRGSKRITLNVPTDTYGTVIITGDGVIFRNYVKSEDEYVLPFMGK